MPKTMYHPLYTLYGCNHSTEDVLFRAIINNALSEIKRPISEKLPMNNTEHIRQEHHQTLYRQHRKQRGRKRRLILGDPLFRADICKRLLNLTVQHVMQRRNRERPQRRGIIREVFRVVDYLGQHKDVLKSFVCSLGMDDRILLMDKRSHSNPVEFES
jgi:hypothetical protein